MTQIKQPKVTISIANANVAVANTPQKVLFVGQKVTAGSAASGALVTNIGNEGEEDALFGVNSQIAEAIRAFRKINGVNRVDAIPLDDAAGVPRAMDFTVAGPSTAAGTITVTVGSETNHKFVVAIASGDSETDIADAITVAVNLDLDGIFTCSNVAGAVTLTADNDGTVANDAGIEVVIDAAGVTLAVDVTETTPGSTDPTLTGVLDVATERYQGINWPYRDETALAAYLTPRFNPTNAILDGVGFMPLVDTLAYITDGSKGYLYVQN